MAMVHTSDLGGMYTQREGDHNPCYPCTKMGMVIGGSGSMDNGHSAFITWCIVCNSVSYCWYVHKEQGQTPLTWLVCIHNRVKTTIYATNSPTWVWSVGGSGCMEMAAVCSLHDVLLVWYCMQRCFVSLLYPHLARAHTSDMACVDNQQGGDHNPDSPHPQNRYVVTGGSGSMKMAVLRSLHDIFHSKVI